MTFLLKLTLPILLLIDPVLGQSARPRVVASDESGVTLEVTAIGYEVSEVKLEGRDYHRVTLDGAVFPDRPGYPAIPEVGAMVAVPFGVNVQATVLNARYETIENVSVHPVPDIEIRGREPDIQGAVSYRERPEAYSTDGLLPEAPVLVTRIGLLRDQRVVTLSVRPIQYHPLQRSLRIAQRMTIRLTFTPSLQRSAVLSPSREARRHPFEKGYRASVLNYETAREWRRRARLSSAQKQVSNWYDPRADWYKIRITEDGVYRLNATWFETAGVTLLPGDIERLKLYVDGDEEPLLVRDDGDGILGDNDFLLFYGRFRRQPDRDFENRLGRDRVYWLRVGQDDGLRYTPQDGSVDASMSEATSFEGMVHAEVDSIYERFGNAPDAVRDHWQGARSGSPLTADGQGDDIVREVTLPGLSTEAGGTARVDVGMHGLTSRPDLDPDHHVTILVSDSVVVVEGAWDGQEAFIMTGEIDAGELRDTLRVTLSTPGHSSYFPTDPTALLYVDSVLLNWITVAYPRSFLATEGMLRFALPAVADSGNSVRVGDLRTQNITVLDRKRTAVLTNVLAEADGAGFGARFGVRSGGTHLVFDEDAIRLAPPAERDENSDLRGERQGASYVVVTHGMFKNQSEQLAEHRRSEGLSAIVVDVQDIFDEFAYGHLTETAIREFMVHAYDTWAERPTYLLLMGRYTYDYRDLQGQAQFRRRSLVPAMPFQSVRRGVAYTDHFFGTVAGDDPFMDVWVGRFSVNNTLEANSVVQKVIGYDQAVQAPWRGKILYMANWDRAEGASLFIADSDNLIEKYTDPFGLEALRVYHDADTPLAPNESSSEVIRQFNEGRLIVNFMGHGSLATMDRYISGVSQQIGFDYTGQIVNQEKLPLVIGMSCLNALYSEPALVCFAEEMTNKVNGGSIAYVSASSLAFIFTNNFINDAMFRLMFREGVTSFGAAVAMAKTDLLTQRPGSDNSTVLMMLMGDPAQKLALPSGPNFSIDEAALTITPEGVLAAADTARIELNIVNEGILPGQSVEVLLIDRNLDQGTMDTLFTGSLPPFGQSERLVVLWPLEGRAGRHRLDALVDPSSLTGDFDPTDNASSRDVEVFGALSALPLFPFESQSVSVDNVRFGLRSGSSSATPLTGEFEIGQDASFEAGDIVRSGPVAGEDGIVTFRPTGLDEGIWYWRGRLLDGADAGAWTTPRSFSFNPGTPERDVLWRQTAEQIEVDHTIETYEDGSLGRTTQALPLRLDADRREAFFEAEGTPATATLATDGTFIYATGFFSTVGLYPFPETFIRIGTGLNGTVAGQNLGPVTDIPVETRSATFHSDGYLYADIFLSKEVLRIRPETGEVDRVPVPDGLSQVENGLIFNGPSLITSDGTDVYNVAWGVDGIVRGGWTVRVFRPEENWRLLRSFEVDPTSTGFAYQFTDGVIADGRYLYLVEFGTGVDHRVRVVSAEDGTFIEEFESDQAETDLLSGQYDWVNDKVWMGQLNGPGIIRYEGFRLPDEGVILSLPIGPAISWGTANVAVSGSGGQALVDVLGEGPGGLFFEVASMKGLNPSAPIDLTGIDPTVGRLRLRLRLSAPGLDRTPSLGNWEVRYQSVSEIGLSNLTQSATLVAELEPIDLSVDVQNLGPTDLVIGTTVGFYAGSPAAGRLIRRTAIPEDTPIGVKRTIDVQWETGQFPGVHTVTAQVEDVQGRSQFFATRLQADEPVEILGSGDREPPIIEIAALDALGEVRAEDYLTANPVFRITIRDSTGVDEHATSIDLRGRGDGGIQTLQLPSSNITDAASSSSSYAFSYQPAATLVDDEYVLTVSTADRVGNGPSTKALVFRVESDLALEQVLTYPNPMSGPTTFTFVLSQPADVAIRVFTLSGRLIRVLETPPIRPGYSQVEWDGLDSDGRRPANGTYLYTVTAETADSRVRVKEKLIIYR
jgi:hypothetical protein